MWGSGMKILFVPNLIVSGLSESDRARILEAAGSGSHIVPARDAATQRRELPDTDTIFGRVHADNFHLAKRLTLVWEIQRKLEIDVARPMLGWRKEYFARAR